MVPDEPHDDDMTFTDKGLTFLVRKELFERVKRDSGGLCGFTNGRRFQILSNLAKASGPCCS